MRHMNLGGQSESWPETNLLMQKEILELHTHEYQDKIFSLLLIYLKLFNKINLPFDLI